MDQPHLVEALVGVKLAIVNHWLNRAVKLTDAALPSSLPQDGFNPVGVVSRCQSANVKTMNTIWSNTGEKSDREQGARQMDMMAKCGE